MLNRSQAKDDFVSTVARLGVAAATRRAVLATPIFSCAAEPDVRFAIKKKRDAGTTLDAPSRIHNLKHTPLDRRRLVT